ncbi:MAG: hypothetical protein Q8936_03315 [Bacillota bacterium]|nr:hypothetical protein [Bacillota bacterium]
MCKNRIYVNFYGGSNDFQKLITAIVSEKLYLLRKALIEEQKNIDAGVDVLSDLSGGEKR